MRLGLVIVSLISAVVVTTVGAVPFLGLVVPNIVSLLFGDNLRRAVPWTAVFGAGFVLVCDIIGRTIRYPYEVPGGHGHVRARRRPVPGPAAEEAQCLRLTRAGRCPPTRPPRPPRPGAAAPPPAVGRAAGVLAAAALAAVAALHVPRPAREPGLRAAPARHQGRRDGAGGRRRRALHAAVPDRHRQPHPDPVDHGLRLAVHADPDRAGLHPGRRRPWSPPRRRCSSASRSS